MNLESGAILGARYRIEAPIGGGGFGTVYRATQLNLGRPVAIKVLHAALMTTEIAISRFQREAELAQRLTHPNTVRVFDFGRTDQGFPYIVWEHLDGLPIDQLLTAQGPMATSRVAHVASQILKALMEAHAAGIVHRDIKPANVILCDYSGEPDFVKILDFGVAKSLAQNSGAMTEGVNPVGTPSYMAPEQVRNETVTPATDLYALGLMMTEMLSGRVVFQGRTVIDVFMAQASDAPVPIPPEVRMSPLGQLIERATLKRPEQRYATAAEMLADLERTTAGHLATVPSWPAARASGPPAPVSPYHPAVSVSSGSVHPTGGGSIVTASQPRGNSSIPVAVALFGGLVAIGVLGAVTAGGIYLASRSDSTPEARPSTARAERLPPPPPAGGEPMEFGARRGKGFDGVGANVIKRKLAATGWQPSGDTIKNIEGTFTETRIPIANGARSGLVSVFRFDEAEDAEQHETVLRQEPESAVARQDAALLQITIAGDASEAQTLLGLMRR